MAIKKFMDFSCLREDTTVLVSDEITTNSPEKLLLVNLKITLVEMLTVE